MCGLPREGGQKPLLSNYKLRLFLFAYRWRSFCSHLCSAFLLPGLSSTNTLCSLEDPPCTPACLLDWRGNSSSCTWSVCSREMWTSSRSDINASSLLFFSHCLITQNHAKPSIAKLVMHCPKVVQCTKPTTRWCQRLTDVLFYPSRTFY